MKVGLDTQVVRGYFLSAGNTDHPFVKQNGYNVIVLARGLNDCWERFVNVKEAMHLLDPAEAATNSPEELEKLLNEFDAPDNRQTSAILHEALAMWMALFCFCPEKDRLEFENLRDKKQIDDYGIALKLKIPEFYVPLLFSSAYSTVRDTILRES